MILLADTGAVTLGEELACGGEGSIRLVEGHPNQLAKVYHRPLSEEATAKLECMVAASEPALRRFAAWPTGLLRRSPGDLAGFLMPRVPVHLPVHLLTGTKSREEHFPNADWGFLLRVAGHVAGAFEALHARGHLVGDVNETNLLVSPRTGSVVFVDCDSFQVAGPSRTFPCRVAVPHFTPPELQGSAAAALVRTPDQEAFSLAVLLFQLLFLGRHPFAGRWSGEGELTTERAIAERRFAFGPGAVARGLAPPPLSVPFELLGPEVARLFARAFTGAPGVERPRPGEWREALATLGSQLRRCEVERSHVWTLHLPACPWCALEAQGALFFAGSTERILARPFLAEVEGLLKRYRAVLPPALERPVRRPMLPSPPAPDSAVVTVARPSAWTRALPPLAAGAVAVALPWAAVSLIGTAAVRQPPWLLPLLGVAALLGGLGAFAMAVLRALVPLLAARQELTRQRREVERRRQEHRAGLADLAIRQQVTMKRLTERNLALRILEGRYRALVQEYSDGLAQARGTASRRDSANALDALLLAGEQIPAAGTAVKAELRRLGITSAGDVLRALGAGREVLEGSVGPAAATALEAWVEARRAGLSGGAATPLDRRQVAMLLGRLMPRGRELLLQLEPLVTQHEAACAEAVGALERLHERVAALEAELEAAKRDFGVMPALEPLRRAPQSFTQEMDAFQK